MISKEKCCGAIASLVRYGQEKGLIEAQDGIWAVNSLLSVMALEDYAPDGEEMPFPACLERLCDYAAENGLIENTTAQRDLFDTRLMGVLTPRPSEVIKKFRALYEQSPRAATDYFYSLSGDTNYIRRERVARDMHWIYTGKYGELEVSINRSKPEKDPRDIAAAKLKKTSGYPKCLLCAENEGYAGTLTHPARQNHRIIPLEICGENWGLQYSPYIYYNEHCIVLNTRHVPMTISEPVFRKLFDFVRQFPHYFVGSNADLPIVGGSILSHEHFQGGRHVFPMEKAEKEFTFRVAGYEDVECAVLKYPMTVIRLNGADADRVCSLAGHILEAWRGYTDEAAFIFAETDGERHNTVTPIARMNGGYELDLVLRNNITTPEHPLGVYHPHEELHHIKKENIGLIEVMGLAILPGRLIGEMSELKTALVRGEDIEQNDRLAKHASWAKECLVSREDWCAENADRIIEEEIGRTFEKVLECAGVYKYTPEGRQALKRFIATL